MRGPRRPRLGRRQWIIALVVTPPALWAVVLIFCPMGWARRAIERRVEEVSGCPTSLSKVRIGPFGGIRLEGLTVLAPDNSRDAPRDSKATPWFEAEAIDIDLSLGQLLLGRAEPSRVEVRTPVLRLVRGGDGKFAPAFLLRNSRPARLPGSGSSDDDEDEGPIAFRLVGGRLIFVDAEVATTIAIEDLTASGTWLASTLEVDDLRGTLNGGHFAMAMEVERGATPAFSGQMEARGVHLGQELGLLTYLVPYLAGVSERMEGRLDLDLELKGQGATGEAIRDSLSGRGMIRIDPIRLEGSSLLVDLARVLPVTQYGRVGTFRSDFQIGDRRVVSQKLQLNLGGTPIILTGASAFDGRIQYQLDTGPLAGKLGPEAVALLGEAGLKPEDLLNLRVSGTADRPVMQMGGLTFDARDEGRSRLEELARRLKQRLLR